jgi:hypothetical protein
MAVLPLNSFKTIPSVIGTNVGRIYTCPVGVTAIILLAQVSNISSTTSYVSFSHVRLATETFLIKAAAVPGNDSLACLTGRLVLQSGDSIQVVQTDTSNLNPGSLQILVSLVESANS